MSPRLRWLAVIAAALCLHLPWWPRAVTDRPAPTRPAAAARVLLRPIPQAPPPRLASRSAQVVKAARPGPGRAPAAAESTAMPPRAAPAPALFVPPPDTVLDYLWTIGPRTQPVRLAWSTAGMAYRVALETPPGTPPRGAGWQRSEGTWTGTAGLAPRRYTARRPGQSEQALSFVPAEDGNGPPGRRAVAFSSTTFRRPVDDRAQDALSWLPHWLGLLQAGDGTQALQAAQPDGRIVTLRFAPADDAPGHWRSTGTGPADDQIDLWLDADPPHWPRRWRHTTPWGSVSEWARMHQNETQDPFMPP